MLWQRIWTIVSSANESFESLNYNSNFCKQQKYYDKNISDTKGKFSIAGYKVFQILKK